MKGVNIGSPLLLISSCVMWIIQLVVLCVIPFQRLIYYIDSDNEEEENLAGVNFIMYAFVYIPASIVLSYRFRRLRPLVLKRILQERSLITAFTDVMHRDLER